MTAFLLSCYMNSVLSGSIHFRSAVDCTFYSEELSGQRFDTPTASQSAFVSVVMGVMTGVFGIWMGHEHKGEK